MERQVRKTKKGQEFEFRKFYCSLLFLFVKQSRATKKEIELKKYQWLRILWLPVALSCNSNIEATNKVMINTIN